MSLWVPFAYPSITTVPFAYPSGQRGPSDQKLSNQRLAVALIKCYALERTDRYPIISVSTN